MGETRPLVLILTEGNDSTASFVEEKLRSRSVPYVRIDTESLLEQLALHVDPASPSTSTLSWRGETFSLESLTGVWYRRAAKPKAPDGFTAEEATLAARETLNGLWGALLVYPGKAGWISTPDAITQADFKIEQLSRAAEFGLRTPNTIVTSCAEDACTFIRTQGKVIAKAVFEGYAEVDGAKTVTWTSIVSEDAVRGKSLAIPMIFQKAINPKTDVRVTVIDDRLWSALVSYEPSDSPAGIDWRASSGVARSEAIHLDGSTASALIRLVRSYGLRFGAVDLAREPDGTTYFLELNAVGEWGWLELEAGLPLRDALIDALTQA